MDPAVPPVASPLVYVQLNNVYIVMSEIHILRSLFSTA